MSVDENEHAFDRARSFYERMTGRGIVRDVDGAAFIYHLAVLIKRERAAAGPVAITGETKGKDPKEHGGHDDCA